MSHGHRLSPVNRPPSPLGLETAEHLVQRGIDVTVVEMADQVVSSLDVEYGTLVGGFMDVHGVHMVARSRGGTRD